MTARGLICAEWNMPQGLLQPEASLLTQAGSGRELTEDWRRPLQPVGFRGALAACQQSHIHHDGVVSQPRASTDASMRWEIALI